MQEKILNQLKKYEEEGHGDIFKMRGVFLYEDLDDFITWQDEQGEEGLPFSIDFTRQGMNDEGYMAVSYYSQAIKHIIGLDEMPPMESKEDFAKWCELETKYINGLEERLKTKLITRTICIEVQGGIVQDVHGLPEGWDYDLADWDELDDCADKDGSIEKGIRKKIFIAQKLNK